MGSICVRAHENGYVVGFSFYPMNCLRRCSSRSLKASARLRQDIGDQRVQPSRFFGLSVPF